MTTIARSRADSLPETGPQNQVFRGWVKPLNHEGWAVLRKGFTLIELLVVIAIIVILAAMLLPGLNRAKQEALGKKCMSNTHQLMIAWITYSSDFKDTLPSNMENEAPGGWVNGNMANTAEAADTAKMLSGEIGPYAQNAGIYKCPADTSIAMVYSTTTFKNVPTPRCRSVSMNFAVGDKSTNGLRTATLSDNWPNFFRMSDFMVAPKTWVISDESATTINDGYQSPFWDNGAPFQFWCDWPATYHNNGAGYAFADGHSEIHQFKDWPWPAAPPPFSAQDFAPNYTDIYWVESHTSPNPSSGLPWQTPGIN